MPAKHSEFAIPPVAFSQAEHCNTKEQGDASWGGRPGRGVLPDIIDVDSDSDKEKVTQPLKYSSAPGQLAPKPSSVAAPSAAMKGTTHSACFHQYQDFTVYVRLNGLRSLSPYLYFSPDFPPFHSTGLSLQCILTRFILCRYFEPE